jgi:uncharacterized membrane protein YoaK (UPF0700 family)
LPPLLLLLTAVAGLIDAVTYLQLGRVFVANMTGNVVLLGFALAGAGGLSVGASLLALGAFLAGAMAGGRLGRRLGTQRRRLLATGTALEGALIGLALVVTLANAGHTGGAIRYVLLAPLALAMGLQAATARQVGVPDLTTVVLTMTLTGLAADSRLAGGTGAASARRLTAAAAMLGGALAGGYLALHAGVAPGLGLATGLLALIGVAGRVQRGAGEARQEEAR